MRIRMLSDQRGADDGFTLRDYRAGQEYDLSHSPRAVELAEAFLRENWASKVAAPVIALEPVAPEASFDELTESQIRKMAEAEALPPAPTAPAPGRTKPEPEPEPLPVLAPSESTGAGGETPEAPRQPVPTPAPRGRGSRGRR